MQDWKRLNLIHGGGREWKRENYKHQELAFFGLSSVLAPY
jgi:hypothetical protein